MGSSASGQLDLTRRDGYERGSRAYRRLLAGLFFAGLATFAQLYSPQAVLPEIASRLAISPDQSALSISAATIGLAIGVIAWSAVADRIGRVRAMSIAVTGSTVIGLLVPFAPSFGVFLAGRSVEGGLLGGVPAIAVAYLSEEIARQHVARAAGIYVAGTTIGGLLGRLVAGPLASVTGWRVAMFTVAVLCAGFAVAFVVLVPRDRTPAPARPGRPATGGLGSRLRANLRSPHQLALYLQGFLLMGGFVALYNYLGFRLGNAPFGLPEGAVSLIFLAYLAGTLSSARAGAAAQRFHRLPVLLTSIAVMIVGTLLTVSPALPVVLAGLVIATGGFFGAHSIASGWTSAAAPTGPAQASSLYNLFYYSGSSVFGWLGGVLFGFGGWAAVAGLVSLLAMTAAAAAALVLRKV